MYGEKLRELREEKELKQIFFSNMLGIKENAYSMYESEYIIIPIKYLNIICDYLNVSFDYIFGLTNNKKYNNSKNIIDLNIVSKRLKEFRYDNSLTQVKLADILNVVKGTIANYESNRSLIATPFLYTICKKYKVSADWLLGKIDEPKYLKS